VLKPSSLSPTGTFPTDKAQILVFLSVQNEHVSHVGIGAKKGYFDLKHPVFDPLAKFIYELAS
jgi:hypothetical protein